MPEVLCAHCERPVPDKVTLCQICGDTIVTDLLEVPGLVVELAITRAGLAKAAAYRTGGRSADTAIPIRVNAHGRGIWMHGDRDLATLENTIGTWARDLADDLGVCVYIGGPALITLASDYRRAIRARDTIDPPDTQRDPAALALVPVTPLEQAAVWLAQHRRILRGHKAAPDLLTDIGHALDRIRRLIDRPIELRDLGACPGTLTDGTGCRAELRARVGASWVRCTRCRSQWEITDIERELRAAAENQLYTLYETLRILDRFGTPVPKTTLYRWAREPRLTPRGWAHRDDTGRTLITARQISDDDARVYRLGDILALAVREQKGGGT